MKLKSKLRVALELGLVTSALPLLLLGCGGGGGGSSTSGMMSGQFWTDLTGTGIREFWPGQLATASSVSSPAMVQINTAAYSGGSYSMTGLSRTISGVAWTTKPNTSYYLAASGWTVGPSTVTFTAPNATTLVYTGGILGSFTQTVTTANLSGTPIVANPVVPAVDSLGNASAVSPASATYPDNSYAYKLSGTGTTTSTEYWVYAEPFEEVTTAASSVTPINNANFNAVGFEKHSSTADPICVMGYGLVHSTGTTYDFYALELNGGVPSGTTATCQNSTVPFPSVGTYDLSFAPVIGSTTVVTFSNPKGTFFSTNDLFGSLVIGVLPALDKAYYGDVLPAGPSTSTSYWMNKTAMDAALRAWGVTPP